MARKNPHAVALGRRGGRVSSAGIRGGPRHVTRGLTDRSLMGVNSPFRTNDFYDNDPTLMLAPRPSCWKSTALRCLASSISLSKEMTSM